MWNPGTGPFWSCCDGKHLFIVLPESAVPCRLSSLTAKFSRKWRKRPSAGREVSPGDEVSLAVLRVFSLERVRDLNRKRLSLPKDYRG